MSFGLCGHVTFGVWFSNILFTYSRYLFVLLHTDICYILTFVTCWHLLHTDICYILTSVTATFVTFNNVYVLPFFILWPLGKKTFQLFFYFPVKQPEITDLLLRHPSVILSFEISYLFFTRCCTNIIKFDNIWNSCYEFSTACNNNVADARTCDVSSTQAPINALFLNFYIY
jgi:hypothetical protein